MIIINLKRKIINISVSLIVIGLIISTVGFGIDGFDLTLFKSSDTQKWYRTIIIDDNFFSFKFMFHLEE